MASQGSPLIGRKAAFLRPTPPLRFSVYLKTESISSPATHATSREFAERLIESGDAHRIGQNTIRLATLESWREIKNRYGRGTRSKEWKRLLKPLGHYPAYNYPLPYSLLRNYAG